MLTRPTLLGLLPLALFAWLPCAGSRAAAPNVTATITTAPSPGLPAAGQSTIEFNRDIRPILSDHCYACHGPDSRKRQAGLRLDQAESATHPVESGSTAVVPGKSSESELVTRIMSTDDETRMPPPSKGKALTPVEIDLLKRWVDSGAQWEGHWSFAPIKRPSPPAVDEANFVRGGIDRFILAELLRNSLPHAAEADRVTLIRRLSFDLTGLPPTAEEVDAFVADTSANAYERLVDRLIASPHFGERMAIFWLDLVRFADTVGYHGDQPVSVYPFRDYVIKSFNENKRFDQFTLEQLAGDLLPQPTLEQRVAAAYNRLGMMSAEGGGQPKEYLAKYAAERVRNASGAWMGVTMGCCECHDHKFDPFATKDFYRFEAFFAGIQEQGIYNGAERPDSWKPMLAVPSDEQQRELARLDGDIKEAQKTLADRATALEPAAEAWEKSISEPIEWTILKPVEATATEGAKLRIEDDGFILAHGKNPDKATYTVTVKTGLQGVTAFRLEVTPHNSTPKKGCGRAANSNFVLTEFKTLYKPAEGEAQSTKFASATASFIQLQGGDASPYGKWGPEGAIDDEAKGPTFGWAVEGEVNRANEAVFVTANDFSASEDGVITFELRQNLGGQHTIGHFRLSATTHPRPVSARGAGLPRKVRNALEVPFAERTAKQHAAVTSQYRDIAPELAPDRERIAQLEAARDKIQAETPRVVETRAVPPRPIRVLPRGNWMDDSGEVVAAGVPAFLPQPPAGAAALTRLDLAQWLVSAENPLTARVLVNRMWKMFFGAGLSRKLDDLGAQGEWPTHPLLLDYLAGQMLDSGWDVKRMVKMMVMSGAYRQASVATSEQVERDPYNRLLGRQSRFRLDAELVRDNALSIAGLLVPEIGGPSVKPYQPAGYWSYLNFPTREWANGQGTELYRRGMYTFWQRQYLHPSMLAFDAPSREECTAERGRSNTPLQSLALLNDPTYVEAARVFAEHVLRSGGKDTAERLDWAMRHAMSRAARPAERERLTALVEKHLAEYKQTPEAATKLITTGASPAPHDLDPAELAAWTSVTRAILNLHEVVTRN